IFIVYRVIFGKYPVLRGIPLFLLKIRIIYKLIHFKNRNNQMFTFSFFKNVLSLVLLFFYLKFFK
ncbi:hypothetical protein DWA26_11985, partial [Acinetobacter baumannii]